MVGWSTVSKEAWTSFWQLNNFQDSFARVMAKVVELKNWWSISVIKLFFWGWIVDNFDTIYKFAIRCACMNVFTLMRY